MSNDSDGAQGAAGDAPAMTEVQMNAARIAAMLTTTLSAFPDTLTVVWDRHEGLVVCAVTEKCSDGKRAVTTTMRFPCAEGSCEQDAPKAPEITQ